MSTDDSLDALTDPERTLAWWASVHQTRGTYYRIPCLNYTPFSEKPPMSTRFENRPYTIDATDPGNTVYLFQHPDERMLFRGVGFGPDGALYAEGLPDGQTENPEPMVSLAAGSDDYATLEAAVKSRPGGDETWAQLRVDALLAQKSIVIPAASPPASPAATADAPKAPTPAPLAPSSVTAEPVVAHAAHVSMLRNVIDRIERGESVFVHEIEHLLHLV